MGILYTRRERIEECFSSQNLVWVYMSRVNMPTCVGPFYDEDEETGACQCGCHGIYAKSLWARNLSKVTSPVSSTRQDLDNGTLKLVGDTVMGWIDLDETGGFKHTPKIRKYPDGTLLRCNVANKWVVYAFTTIKLNPQSEGKS